MKTKNIVEKICEKRERYAFSHASLELVFRMEKIKLLLKNPPSLDPEILKYFPVAIVACIEGYFRMVIEEIIDFDDCFLDRSMLLLS